MWKWLAYIIINLMVCGGNSCLSSRRLLFRPFTNVIRCLYVAYILSLLVYPLLTFNLLFFAFCYRIQHPLPLLYGSLHSSFVKSYIFCPCKQLASIHFKIETKTHIKAIIPAFKDLFFDKT